MGRDQPAATGTEEQAESAPLARWEAARDEAEQERGRRQAAEERVERLTALLARERELRQEAQREARALGAQLGSAPAEVLVRRRRRRIRRVPLLRRLRRRPQRPAQLG